MPAPDPRPEPRRTGAGAPIVAALFVGLVAGVVMRQPTLGFLAGLAAGIGIAVALWLRERGRG